MSDQSSPPPKKVGSLRDRIAAFEKSASSAPPPGPAPAPRPKPAGFASWKPKPPSPPSSPSATTTENAGSTKPTAMSASDAKESITKAGSLKERMAALQGKGAFGAPPPIAPKPAVERPKWKPPPVVHAPADEDDQAGEGPTAGIAAAVERTISPPTSIKSHEGAEPHAEGEDAASHATPAGGDGEHEGETAADPEEEERQRRAAIAARIARLGGARVGMAPPVFGRPPPVRRPTQEETRAAEVPKLVEEPPKVDTAGPEPVKPAQPAASPPAIDNVAVSPPLESLPVAEAEGGQSPETAIVCEDSEGASVPSSESVETPPAKGLASMPIPAVPRRTGPPRKKPVKPAAPPPEVPAEDSEEKTEAPAAAVETDAEKTPDEVSIDASKELYDPALTLQHEDIAPKVVAESTPPSITAPVGSDVKPDVTPEPTKHEESAVRVAISTSESHPAPQAPPSTSIDDLPAEISDLSEEASGVRAPPPSLATATPMDDSGEDSDEDVEIASKAPVVAPSYPTQLPVDLLDKELQEEIKEGIITADDDADEEAEEEARKKRIAERLAKMGGVNPFAPPPVQAKLSSGSEMASTPIPSSPPPAVLAPRSPSPEPVQPTHKESLVGEQPKSELEDSDSDYDEEDVHDGQPALAISGRGQKEKPEATTVPASTSDHIVSVPQSPPPPIPRSTRPQFPVQHDDHKDSRDAKDGGPPPLVAPTPQRPPIDNAPEVGAPPPAALTEPPSPPARPAQQPRRLVPSAPEDDDEPDDYQTDEEAEERLAQSQLFILPPTGRASDFAHPRRANIQDEDDGAGNGSENDGPPLPILHRRSMEAPPATSARKQAQQSLSDEEEDDENAVESDHDGRALPIPPPHPATAIAAATVSKSTERKTSGPPPRLVPPPPPAHPPPVDTPSSSNNTPSLSVSGSEVLDEEEGDPIDPSFHSPSRQTSLTNLRGQAQAEAQVQPTALARPPPLAHSPPPAAHSPPPARPPPVPSAPPARSPPHVHSPPPVRSLPLAHSPPSTFPPPAPPAAEPADQLEEDAEQLRRKTIAERMAKLGGIKFGAPLPTPGSRPPPPPVRHEEEEQEQDQDQDQDQEQTKAVEEEEKPTELTEEEEERARKERIAAKLASMGGMRIGMMPMGMGGLPPQRSHVLREETPSTSPPPATTHVPPPARAVPPARPPPPPTQPSQPHHVPDTDSEYGSAIASDDGVKVEAEESEIEEVNYEDAEPEEAPPPIPSRTSRPPVHRQESTEKPTSPPPRPPVPTSMPVRRSSVQTTGSASETGPSPPQRKTSSAYVPPAQSDYVMVEGPENQEAPPPPVRRMSRPPPSRSAPQIPQEPVPPAPDTKDSISSQWELPSIPTSTFGFEGGEPDLSLSWTDAGEPSSVASSTQLPSSPPPPPPPAKQQQPQRKASIVDKPMSADELMGVWGRVGVQVCEVATTLFERSKKALIGDGTYAGFVVAVLAGVPNAAPIPVLVNRSSTSSAPEPTANSNEHTYGYLVYVQNGAAVQRRASEIMPGDIVEIHDAKLRGHKGIQMYHQNVGGDGETLVGIVGEFEAKKSKIRVFHANQHVGQQTVESVSYRLEDLKSGLVKVYRVMEA